MYTKLCTNICCVRRLLYLLTENICQEMSVLYRVDKTPLPVPILTPVQTCATGSHLPYTGGPTESCAEDILGPGYWGWDSPSLLKNRSPQGIVVPPSQGPSHFALASWRREESCNKKRCHLSQKPTERGRGAGRRRERWRGTRYLTLL
jgi:hypothetical protein